MVVDSVAAGLSRRPSQKDLLDRRVLKRPPSESKIIAAAAVSLERAFTTDRVNDRIATTFQAFAGVSQTEVTETSGEPSGGISLKDRTQAYMKAVREANATRSPATPGIMERMRAYQDAAKSSTSSSNFKSVSPTKSTAGLAFRDSENDESKTMDSPKMSLKERMQVYQEATSSKSSPRSPVLNAPSFKERLATYQETASSTPNIKKQVEIGLAGQPNAADIDDEGEKD
jgi:hypothetical protein